MTDSITGRLAQHARERGKHPAVVTNSFQWTYAELADRVSSKARSLAAHGVTGHSVLGLHAANDVEHLVLCLAAAELGAHSFAAPEHGSGEEQAATLGRFGASHSVDSSRVAPIDTPASPELPQAPCVLLPTSGTTGTPKVVVLRHSDLVAQALRHIQSDAERFACLAGMQHNFAKRHRLYCVAQGAINIFPAGTPGQIAQECRSLEINTLHVSAFQARALLAEPDMHLPGLRLKLGGSHVPETLRTRLRDAISPQLQCGYGTTETGAIAFTSIADAPTGSDVGMLLPGVEVHVTDEAGALAPVGQTGRLWVRCEGMFAGYLGQPDLTRKALAQGWFETGDLGRIDDDGRLTVSGRADDMFVFNSMNILPEELETQLCSHPGVADAVVVPQASTVHDSIPVGLIVAHPETDLDLAELRRFMRQKAGIRCPRRFVRIAEVPRTPSGKIRRDAAMALLNQAITESHGEPS